LARTPDGYVTGMDVGMLFLRVVLGGLLIGHGTQKLFGWFGGGGIDGTAGMFEKLRFREPRGSAVLAGLGEAGGGLLIALGALTPVGAVGIVGVMITATVAVHLPNGLWNTKGGYELPLLNGVVALAIVSVGPGRYSVDHLLGWDPSGAGWAIGVLVVAALLASVVLALRRPQEAERFRSDSSEAHPATSSGAR
jgi:putative oxidoreductase